jgi:hypothetical protein
MVTIHNVQQGTEEWHRLREGLYTGSGADKLLKFGAIDYSKSEDGSFTGNFWTRRGHILEDEAIELYEQIMDIKVDRVGFVTNSKYPTAGYSPDGLAPIQLIEVKCFDVPEHKKLLAGDINLKVLAQCHFGQLITERPYVHLLAYNPSKELDVLDQFKIITIKPKRAIQQNFRRRLKS